jgi:integrase
MGYKEQIQNYVEKIENGGEEDVNGNWNSITDAEKDHLLTLRRKLRARRDQVGLIKQRDHLGRNYRLARDTDVDITEGFFDETIAEHVTGYIHDNYENPETNRDYRTSYKYFSKLVTEGNTAPSGTKWISSSYSSNYDKTPDPSDMIRLEEMRKIADACPSPRDAALIALAWDSGARPAELRQMLYKDIDDYKRGFQAFVRKSKTETRNVKPLIHSVEYLERWLDEHPTQNPEDALWCRTKHISDDADRLEPISKSYFSRIFKNSMDRVDDINRPHQCRYYRKSMQAFLSSQGVNEPNINKRAGRDLNSDEAKRYTAVFGDEHVEQVAEAYGVEIEGEESPDVEPEECPRCNKLNDADADFCWNCHQALSYGAAADLEDEEERIRREVLSFAAENPEVLGKIDAMEQMLSNLEDRPELLTDARKFAEALDGGD